MRGVAKDILWTVSSHLCRSYAAVFASHQFKVASMISFWMLLRLVILGLQLFCVLCGFHSIGWRVMFRLREWPIYFQSLLLIGSWPVLFHKSLLVIISGQSVPRIPVRYWLIRLFTSLMILSLSMSQLNRTMKLSLQWLIFSLVMLPMLIGRSAGVCLLNAVVKWSLCLASWLFSYVSRLPILFLVWWSMVLVWSLSVLMV